MTEKEIFLKFCKLNKMMPYLVGKFYSSKVCDIMFDCKLNMYINRPLMFNEYFEKITKFSSMNSLFFDVFSRLTNYGYNGNEEYRKSVRKWDYFVKNNLFINENSLKVGDVVEARNFPGQIAKLKVEKISIPHSNITGYDENNKKRIVNFSDVFTVNGEAFKPNYYFKIRRKLYGIN